MTRSPAVRVLPSAVTVLALSAGLTSVKFALDGRPVMAVLLIGAAAILDALDGRIARMLDATSKMGAELDSLADGIGFGVAPGLVLYLTLLDGSNAGWLAALLYTVCIVLRLARFNTLASDSTRPPYAGDFFVGVPAPAAALAALAPLVATLQFGEGWWSDQRVVFAWTIVVAGLAVSRVPTLSLKSVAMPQRLVAATLVLVGIAAALLMTYPFILLLLLTTLYMLHIPYAVYSSRWLKAHPEHWDRNPKERREQRRAGRRRVIPRPSRNRVRVGTSRLGLRRPKV